MGRGTKLEVFGVLRQDKHQFVLQTDDGGTWRLDSAKNLRPFLGLRVKLAGERDGFDLLSVERIGRA
ncbi:MULTISPECIES: DUF5818 domain-containing protein [unclassified Sphingobium]|uniref:DUF5818 domain-containing protein n=1 Tax=unclassified Sphingobium TaxID=2611147 RepID=UPI0022251B53|nr:MULTISPECIES: DUF5818 domain-containing protein [unclassified Sphingobium]MCW2396180.1 hypothetical protein [Sphingobium sp. B8D3B]MCW2419696.1 hypothetical protein [Sphingobium sp. B8D3C]